MQVVQEAYYELARGLVFRGELQQSYQHYDSLFCSLMLKVFGLRREVPSKQAPIILGHETGTLDEFRMHHTAPNPI